MDRQMNRDEKAAGDVYRPLVQDLSGSTSFTSPKNAQARHLFDGIATSYDTPAQVFSLFQYIYWRRFLVSRLKLAPQSLVLDVGTGPGGVASYIARQGGCRVVGADLSEHMLRQAQMNLQTSKLTPQVSLVNARAENLPFPDRAFDVVVFTFLFRYVEEPNHLIRELARVLKPGGQIATLEFYVPGGSILHPLWLLHTRLVMPLGTRFMSSGWREVGSFLGPSISGFFRRYTLGELERMWVQEGLTDVQTKVLSRGGAFVMWGQKKVHDEN